MSEAVCRELNIEWNCADWKAITADGNRSNWINMTQSMSVNMHCVIISMSIFIAKFKCEQVIVGCPWET